MSAVTRTRLDRCPGVLRPWRADDGDLLRVRLPGGRVSASGLTALADIAEREGDGYVHLTSRANVQLRGLAAGLDVSDEIEAVGLLPRRSHDLVRNITCSPLTGLAGGIVDLRGVVADLDEALLEDDALAGLPGKFLFALDDGRGDIAAASVDLGAVVIAPDSAQIVVGERADSVVAVDQIVATLIDRAHRFLAVCGEGESAAWHVQELPGQGVELGAAVRWERQDGQPPAYGPIRQNDGRWAVHLDLHDGAVPADRVREIASYATGLVITPWRGIVLYNLDYLPKELA
ncbi:hypothetical protein [Luteipulveratus mongoliensis]|uniref:Nitrite/Sulfite reductase ferredoxin-like domain-containing protein n=1 Tax=Luteipulveratus mongoliensis TaxID=571913 RepID=A0A0K1JMK4_9MICO|nr:hypothetical protein [Luteipulveratus mongoliensis]AKU17805.1 hypothetical protein VV02_21340 [Luteipulveratus mongoliensis]